MKINAFVTIPTNIVFEESQNQLCRSLLKFLCLVLRLDLLLHFVLTVTMNHELRPDERIFFCMELVENQ